MSIWPMRRVQIFLYLHIFLKFYFIHCVQIIMSEETNSPKTSRPPRMDSNSMGHPVFGDLLVESFSPHRLPTFLQVLNRVRFFKSQPRNREDPLRPIYKLVASELSSIWKEAFVVPVIGDHNLATKLQTEIEKKLNHVQSVWKRLANNPEKLSAELSEMKKIYSISKCTCFLKTTHRQDVIRSNCNCSNPIVNLECYGDQIHGFGQIIIFEEEKVAFAQKVAEMDAKPLPTPPSSAESVNAGYGRTHLENKRARPLSFGPLFDPEDVDMEAPVQDEVNYDTVLETMLSQGLKPFAIMKCISKFIDN